MLTVELLEQALEVARRAGYQIRQEWLDGCQPGACVIKGQKWLFLDPTQSPREQLQEVIEALSADPAVATLPLSPQLAQALSPREAA